MLLGFFFLVFFFQEAVPLYIFPQSYLINWMRGHFRALHYHFLYQNLFVWGKYHSGRNEHGHACNTAPLVVLKPNIWLTTYDGLI